MSSPDLASWGGLGSAFSASAVAWADASSGSNFTSPSVVRFDANPQDQRFVLYFTGKHAGTGERCIGVASAGDPRGPFIAAAEPLICPRGGAQDPSFVATTESTPIPQLVYRMNGGAAGLYNQVLSADGLSIPTGLAPNPLFEAHPSWWHQEIVERPTVAVDGVGGVYLFFAAARGIDRAIGWSPCIARLTTATSPVGPWSAPQTLYVADHGCPTKETGARAWVDHPWLAMNGGRSFAVSYFRPGEYGTSCPNQIRLTYINLARAP